MSRKKPNYPIPIEELHSKKFTSKDLNACFCYDSKGTCGFAGEIFHYTSPEGLKGILSSRTIFFTDYEFLNDTREKISINDDVSLFWITYSHLYDKEFYDLLKNIRINIPAKSKTINFELNNDSGVHYSKYRYFVMSASCHQDSLNMWKYYSKGNSYNGYSIGILTPAFTDEWIECDEKITFEEGVVIYNRYEKEKAIKEFVDELYHIWCEYEKNQELDLKIQNKFKSWLDLTSLFFKNECFSGESEYRFVIKVLNGDLNKLEYKKDDKVFKLYDFRIVNGVLTPFIRFPFDIFNEDCWVVCSITVGPSLNAEQRILGLEQYIKSLNYRFGNCQIKTSSIPLRY